MREILFRGKSVDDNEWVYGSLCIDAVEQLHGVDAGANAFIRFYDTETKKMKMVEVQRETVGQYTGLKDINGKKIFEGDICSYIDYLYSYGEAPYCEGEWFYENGQFEITGGKKCKANDLICNNEFDGCIIGNIHDKEEK